MEPHPTPSTPPTSPSIEDQLAELRATLASMYDQMRDQHAKTKEILARLLEATDLAHRSIDDLQVRLESQQCSIDDLRAKLATLDDQMRENDANLAEAITLLAGDDDDNAQSDARPTPSPTVSSRFFR